MLARIWRKGNPSALLVGMQTGAATVESSMETFDPAIPLLGIYSKEPETLIRKNISTPMFFSALFTIAKKWKRLSAHQ